MKNILILVVTFCFSLFSNAAVVTGQGTWETTLLARDLDGDLSTIEAYYDTVQDITWLADANYAFTSGYSTVDYGLMNWANANAWADSLTLGGYTDWRLPTTLQPDTSCDVQSGGDSYGYSCTGGEMGDLFYSTLGNTAGSLTNTGPFSNVQSTPYWLATEFAPDTTMAWRYDFSLGYQGYDAKFTGDYSWTVHDGDIGNAIVPIPATASLFLSAISGLTAIKKITNK